MGTTELLPAHEQACEHPKWEISCHGVLTPCSCMGRAQFLALVKEVNLAALVQSGDQFCNQP